MKNHRAKCCGAPTPGGCIPIRCYTATPVRPPSSRVLRARVGIPALHARAGFTACLAWIGLLLVGSACGGWRGYGDTYYRRWERGVRHEATYRFGMPGDGWRPLKEKGVQVAWWNDALDAAILLDSQCERHGDSTLEAFTDHLRIDFREWEVKSQEKLQLNGRDALRSVVEASIDGGPKTMMELIVTKKNGCLFDLEYVAPPHSFEGGRAAFARVVAGFTFPIRGE